MALNNQQKKTSAYLDYNATSPIRPQVLAAMAGLEGVPLNPSSPHTLGKKAKQLVQQARTNVKTAVGGLEADLYFTSGGTEANSLVLNNEWDHIFCSATEHASIYQHPQTTKIPVLKNGIVDLEVLKKCLDQTKGKRVLVSVHWANNETGIIQPLQEIVEIAHHYKAYIHTDGVQVFGRIPLSFDEMGLDFLSISSHKVGGSQGSGAVVCRKGLSIAPIFHGGAQENKVRPGTENVRAIVGFGEAVKWFDFDRMMVLEKHFRELEDKLSCFFSQLGHAFFVIGAEQKRLPQTSCLGVRGGSNQSQLICLDLKGVSASIGSACSSGAIKPSHVLCNMGVQEEERKSSIRISAGWHTTEEELLLFYDVWTAFWAEKQKDWKKVRHGKELNIS